MSCKEKYWPPEHMDAYYENKVKANFNMEHMERVRVGEWTLEPPSRCN